ncbi:nicotinate-nucleotide--dimethylbenzimidazole phosphoribosyltransferase [Parvibaculum indicum]|uniref:nicotinate-nucleotide--dimethylbenzimidazole phosphoribosyltransferase n=1 Tax=Parvibaculum indicum TaxID=562969 RepID=UPI001FE61B49|nr:nicotinate-nucleotide--dimethylbenzimidazole phosphoribosyltransferase [Parvibaculum indicum]NIJ41944.1 nicotinate-nucleotide--dimethylbenzimidazole phosphoribosyltransferase [Parvibaculum indicum]
MQSRHDPMVRGVTGDGGPNNNWLSAPVRSLDPEARRAASARQLQLTKPPGSLGRLEEAAISLAAMQGRECPAIDAPHVIVFAGDHGIVEEGVSAFPAEVTGQMILNFLAGGAAISVLAREQGAVLSVIDAGSRADDLPGDVVLDKKASGTANFRKGPAMSDAELAHDLAAGRRAVRRAVDAGADLLVFGEMGIGNTSSAAAVASALTGRSVAEICGPGTGLTEDGVAHKARVLSDALLHHGLTEGGDPLDILMRVGGHEIAALTGAFVAAAQAGLPVLVDGFICSAAVLAAGRINPGVENWLLFAHASAEPGHRILLDEMNASPLLDLGMRLGEGSGAAVALPLLRLACALHAGMATFESAGVSEKDKA